MPSLHISEHSSSGGQAVSMPALAEQSVAIGTESQQSKPFNEGARVLVVQADVACAIVIGKGRLNATDQGTPLSPGRERQFNVEPGCSLAVIQTNASSGDGMAAFFAILADPKAAEARYSKIATAQAALETTVAENRALAERAATDRAEAEAARTEAYRISNGFEDKAKERTAAIDRREAQVSAREAEFKQKQDAFDNSSADLSRTLAAREGDVVAREDAVNKLQEQAAADALEAANLKAKYERALAKVKTLTDDAE